MAAVLTEVRAPVQAERIAATGPVRPAPGARRSAPVVLDDQDEKLLAAVRRDGRIAVIELATALGCSPAAPARPSHRVRRAVLRRRDRSRVPRLLGVQAVETAPVIRTAKRAGTLLERTAPG
ncbi:AsnC family protein [Pseudonocardia sp. GCM10023141]|uniref:AsnC family protein n=1 Tax=Pseudonocardia sp. GCM10023141 TaxID=3252653 RepID=UPI00361AE6CD